MRILITGGAGFLGSHLSDMLLQSGHSVICMDNLLTGRMDNLAHLLGHERFSFIKYDVCDYLHVEGPLDAVMHFASPASPQDYMEFPIATMKVGAMGTHKVLGLARAKSARFILASTSEVYGDPLVNPQPETYWGNVNPISPRGVYDEAKRFAEAMTMAFHRYHGVDTRIVRIFNTFGPRMRPHDGRVVSSFIVQALQGKPLSVFGDGLQTRSFCYVDDLARGIISLLMLDSDKTPEQRMDRKFLISGNTGAEMASMHEPVNIGNPRELTVMEIAKLVLELTRSSSQITHHPLPADDPKVRRPDISRARALLNWEPQVLLEDALLRTIDYFKKVI
ncbi:MAG: SDR family oxidoreductase [Nitrospira sp.]|nr:SDR family oxidoreductase [Nitrospira sp.]MDW7654449.1 UDP-glucuronic acid decarboxylase family protein [Nitrospiraceae bacterium]PHX89935.1 MAG: NAD-dependent dehydratase [Nitrospirota bacterium]MBP0121496.1 SDR family oxidoreductase [Nitrospira sp.]MBP0124321.1 SDR family oxidoreductase [Nitrospira sp.]